MALVNWVVILQAAPDALRVLGRQCPGPVRARRNWPSRWVVAGLSFWLRSSGLEQRRPTARMREMPIVEVSRIATGRRKAISLPPTSRKEPLRNSAAAITGLGMGTIWVARR